MLLRCSVLFLAACATAGGQQAGANGNGPAPDAARSDAVTSDAPGHAIDPDAAPSPDAVVTPDAPANPCAYSGVLATWSLAGEPGSQAATAVMSSAPGVTATSLSRSAALTAVAGSGSINSSGWPTAAQLDATKYYTVSIAPPSGCTMAVSSIALDMRASTTGPASAAVATSADSFAQTTAASPNATSTPAMGVTGISGTVEIRIYGYAATGATGTMRVQNTLQVSGSLQ